MWLNVNVVSSAIKEILLLTKAGAGRKKVKAHIIYIYENSFGIASFKKIPPGDSNIQQNLGTTAVWD